MSKYNKYLQEKLDNHEKAVCNLESELKMTAASNKDATVSSKSRNCYIYTPILVIKVVRFQETEERVPNVSDT